MADHSRSSDRRRSVVLLSGGIDSATVGALLIERGWGTDAVFVDYGQRAVAEEREASRRIADHLGIRWQDLTVRGFEPLAFVEVRGRNDLLLALAAAATPATAVAIGTHAGTSYADCSPAHNAAWQLLFDTQYGGSRRLLVPLQELTKAQVVALARRLGVPLAATYSCEDAGGPCGACISCRDREAVLAGS